MNFSNIRHLKTYLFRLAYSFTLYVSILNHYFSFY